jgi:plastocyanin
MRRSIIALAFPLSLAAALVFGAAPAAAGGGGGCFQPDTQGAGTTVTLTERCFSPTVLYVQPGGTVTWKNEDGMRHVVVGSLNSWGSPVTLEAGQVTTHQFAAAGIFPYSCPLHYGMNGVVIVGDGKASVPLARVLPAAAATAATATPRSGADPWPLLALIAAAAAGALGYGLGRRPTVTRP